MHPKQQFNAVLEERATFMQVFCTSSVRLLLLGSLVSLSALGSSQVVQLNAGPPVTSSENSVPLQHLYWHFLMYQHHLDLKAAQMEKEGTSGTAVRSFMQAKLNMADAQYEPIHRAADSLSAALADLNTRAQHLRLLYIQSKPPKDGPLTSEQQTIHDQLKAMNDEREKLLTEQMNKLDNELSGDDRASFRDFLTNQIAPGVITVKLPNSASQSLSLAPATSGSGGGK